MVKPHIMPDIDMGVKYKYGYRLFYWSKALGHWTSIRRSSIERCEKSLANLRRLKLLYEDK